MDKSTAPKNNSIKIFLILVTSAIVLALGVTLTVFLLSRDSSPANEYLPKDYGDDPSGLDDDYSARY